MTTTLFYCLGKGAVAFFGHNIDFLRCACNARLTLFVIFFFEWSVSSLGVDEDEDTSGANKKTGEESFWDIKYDEL